MKPLLSSVLSLFLLLAATATRAQDYRPADESQRPEGGGVRILPEQFLRGFDPVTVYFPDNVGPGKQSADDGAKRLKVVPTWPGQWFWADRKTLQFRPAEPWPALARFSFEASGARKILTTMMSAPSEMSPTSGSTDLKPFRTLTLTFPQALPLDSLKKMLRLEVRDLPGLADSPTRVLKDWTLSQLPRATQRDPAIYALTLDQDVPEGKLLRVNVSLALGDEDKVLWVGRLSTRPAFHLEQIQCGDSQFSLSGGASTPRDMALACGHKGEAPQLVFSAPVDDLTLTALKKLVRLEPAVPDLSFRSYGARVSLRGRFVPDTLYRMRIGDAPVHDDSGRPLRDPGDVQVFFHLDFKQPFLGWMQSTAVIEAKGPRMLPLQGYGDARADVRIYRVDPLHAGLWPFPQQAILINEESPPPFPGEEPEGRSHPAYIGQDELMASIRLLGSPLVSTLVDLPLAKRGGTTTFGLDLAPLLNPVVGKNRPGTYLVGLRRLTGAPERAYVRVQITNLSLTTVEERDKAIFYVRTLDEAREVKGARIVIEGQHRVPVPGSTSGQMREEPFTHELTTDATGRAALEPHADWARVERLSVQNGEDVLVMDPREPPPAFSSNHWASSSWLAWLGQHVPPPPNDGLRGFLFTERPIYRPGEKVYIKGFLRNEVGGEFQAPEDASKYVLHVKGQSDQVWTLPVSFTALYGLSAEFQESNPPTGDYTVTLDEVKTGRTLATRNFKIEAYRLPTFEVQLSSPVTARLDGPFKVKAVARYYAGGNVAGQPIAWTVTRRPYYYVPKGREGFLFASSNQFARQGQSRVPEAITRSATLDDNGADELSINPALDLDGSARSYHFEATVTGADSQTVSATQDVRALPPFVLGMKLPRYSDKPLTLAPEIIAVGVDDKPIKGQEVLVRLYKRIWHSQLRETHFATGEAKYVTEQEDVKLAEKTLTTDVNPVAPPFELKEAGVYVVELVARDKLGRVQTLSADLYVGGQTPIAWQKSRQGVFGLTSDKTSYKPGETARLILQSPFQEGHALVVVEEPGGNTYTWHDVTGGKAVHELAIRAQHVPNVPVHVLLMRGRLGEGDKDDSRYRPQTLGASVDVKVEPVSKQVLVELKHPETARPGNTLPVEVSLKDPQGKPLAGEVTLWLVDEAVLSLAREATLNPLDELIQEKTRTTTLRDTRNNLVGKLFEQEEEPGGDGSDEESKGGGKRVVRKNFQTVPYYQATLQVPASGKLTVQVPLSDDLTNFRVRAVAVSGLQRFGYKQTVLRVRLPVLVQPQLPRFVRQGDHFWGGAVGRVVEGPGGPGTVTVKVTGPADIKPLGRDVELLANRASSFITPITIKNADVAEPQTLKVRVDIERKSDKAGDAFEVQLPVLPDRTVEHFAYFDTLQAGQVALRPLPEPARPGTASQELVISSVPGVLEVIAGLEYLADYPYGCLEQKLSRLYPYVADAAVLRELGLNTAYGKQVATHLRRLQEEMGQYQDEHGLFSFWPGGAGDIQVTAQAVEFLDAARRAGFTVEDKLQTHAVEGLKHVLRSDYPGLTQEWRYNQQTAALRALTRLGALDEHYLVDLFQLRERVDVQSLADLTSTMISRPSVYRAYLDTLRTELWDSVIFKLNNGKPVFAGLKWRRNAWDAYGYLSSEPASVAAVFEALVRVDPTNPRLDQLRDALLSYANATRGFGSTQDNRRAIDALALYLEKARPVVPDTTVTLSSGASLQVGRDTKTAHARVMSDATLSATVKGGPVGLRMETTYVAATPGDHVEALKQGFLVSRSATWLRADGSPPTRFDDKAGEVHALQVGDILELHTSVVTEQNRTHVAVVVPFAAGLEPLNPELANAPAEAKPSEADSTTPSYVQRLDNEVRYFFLDLPRGTHTFHFRVRATTEGSFIHPAPHAEQMYHEAVRGRGEGLRLVVKGEHEK